MQAAKDDLNGVEAGGGVLHCVVATAVEALLPEKASDRVLANT
jgi:hypothetical protein